ncbi:hypothetical protein DOE78_02165 [Bacillus sp. Y1]|jgi:hypothetical protein|uniref:hypothetical protein n=1 Tax=Robertmurraya sp. TaxID=2837525 RepID=UPI000E6B31D1|nr:hypothetical protein [Bacillus sp. Y1]AYA74349.1 hypothetical protein DOE78_02165 [Bacillus sp. Y1]
MLKRYLENRGIYKETILISPITGRTFSIERLIESIEKENEEIFINVLNILPFRNDKHLLINYLSGIGEGYLRKFAL